MKRAALILIGLIATSACSAEQIEVIDLLHLNAPEFAASLAGGGGGTDALARETTAFALDVLQDVSQQTYGRSSVSESLSYSRARAIPGAGADLSGLLPDGLASAPVATPNRNALIVLGVGTVLGAIHVIASLAIRGLRTAARAVALGWRLRWGASPGDSDGPAPGDRS